MSIKTSVNSYTVQTTDKPLKHLFLKKKDNNKHVPVTLKGY